MATNAGPNLTQLPVDSLLRYRRETYFGPEATSVNKLVASVDPSSAVTVGVALTLQSAASGFILRRPRRPTLVLTDASGGAGGLSVTVKFIGARWGNYLEEIVTVTCTDGAATTGACNNAFSEITSIVPLIVTSAAVNDALTCGIEGTSFGLDFPIDNVADVISIINVSTNTEAAPTAISTSTVVAGAPATNGKLNGGSYIKGITLATTDRWEVQYLVSRKYDASGVVGVWR